MGQNEKYTKGGGRGGGRKYNNDMDISRLKE